jgi:hypothetical protein
MCKMGRDIDERLSRGPHAEAPEHEEHAMQDFPQPAAIRYGQPTLTGMLARQRQDDVARAAERRRVSAVERTTPRARRKLQERIASLRPTLARAVVTRVARARTAPVAQHPAAACCV